MPESLVENVEFEKNPPEKCGIVGVYAFDNDLEISRIAHDLLLPLQHRGQDAAGILVTGAETAMFSDNGYISEVFQLGGKSLDVKAPEANIALAHTRYSTSGEGRMPYKGFAFNGNIANFEDIAERYGIPEYERENDGMTIGSILNRRSLELEGGMLAAIKELAPQLHGGFAMIVTDGIRLFGFRDSHGIKPLSYGSFDNEEGAGLVFVSEDRSINANDMKPEGEVNPSEIIIFDQTGVTKDDLGIEPEPKLCMFEDIYYMKPDSHHNGELIRDKRYRLGQELAKEYPIDWEYYRDTNGNIDKDKHVVVGVPESSLPAAEGLADGLGIKSVPGLVKNPDYQKGRSFILNSQAHRKQAVRDKFHVNKDEVKDKIVYLSDDSIVRSTTVTELVEMLYEAGAAEVHIRIYSPPIKWPCFYGVNMGHGEDSLIASEMHPREMSAKIGSDSLGYLSIEGLARGLSLELGQMCMGCIKGIYPTPVPITPERLNKKPASLAIHRAA